MNRENIKLAKNYLYNLAYQIFCILVPLVTTPYISRILGAQNIGIYSYTLSVSTYFIVAGNLGFPLYGQREIAYCAEDRIKRSEIFFEITIIRSACLVFSTIIYCIICLVCVKDNRIIYEGQIIGIVANIIDVAWFFQGIEEFKTLVLRNFLIKTVSIIGLFVFVKDETNLLTYVLVMGLANLLGNCLLFLQTRKYLVRVHLTISSLRVKKCLQIAFTLGIPYYITSIYALLDKTMLGYISDDFNEVGFYDQSQKIITFALTIVTSLGVVFLPRLSKEFEKFDRKRVLYYLNLGLKVIFFLACPIMVGLFMIASILVPWFFGIGYEKVEILIQIFSPLILIMGVGNLIGNQYLIAIQKETKLTITILIGVALNFLLNCILIPKYFSVGAALATIFSELVKMILQFFFIKEDILVKEVLREFIIYFSGSMVMGIVLWILKNNFWFQPTVKNTIGLVLSGIVVYGLFILLLNRKIIRRNKGR